MARDRFNGRVKDGSRLLVAVLAGAVFLAACGRKPAASTTTGTTATPAATSTATTPAAVDSAAATVAGAVNAAMSGVPANLRPNPSLTPGDVLTTDSAKVCQKGYASTVRNVPTSVKNLVYKRYGIASRKPGEYEVDHLISLELGGSNSIQNLWPEAYGPLYGAHLKDKLENALHAKVCSGEVALTVAQKAIASDWVAAYQKYVGPLPKSR